MVDSKYETILEMAAPEMVTTWVQTIEGEGGRRVVALTKDTYEGPYYTRAEVLEWLASYDPSNDLRIANDGLSDSESLAQVAIHRAGNHIARRTLRAKGNKLARTPTGWMVFYSRDPFLVDTRDTFGSDAPRWITDGLIKKVGDGPIQWVGTDQYVLVPGLVAPEDYFWHITDPGKVIDSVISKVMEDSPGWSYHVLGGYRYD